MGGALLNCVGDGVGQDQPALCIGVDDLDRLPVGAGYDVTRTLGGPAHHVLGDRDDRHHVEREAPGGDHVDRGQHRGRARHVALHGPHLLGRLDGKAPGVEGDALAHQSQAHVGPAAADQRSPVLEPDKAGSQVGTGADAEEKLEAPRL